MSWNIFIFHMQVNLICKTIFTTKWFNTPNFYNCIYFYRKNLKIEKHFFISFIQSDNKYKYNTKYTHKKRANLIIIKLFACCVFLHAICVLMEKKILQKLTYSKYSSKIEIWVSKSMNSDQVDDWSGVIWIQTVCKGYQ